MKLLKYALLGTATVFTLYYLNRKKLTDEKTLVNRFIKKGPKLIRDVNDIRLNIKRDYQQTRTLY